MPQVWLYYCTNRTTTSGREGKHVCGTIRVREQPWDPGSDTTREPYFKCHTCDRPTHHQLLNLNATTP